MAQEKPVYEIRRGHIRAAIWANKTEGRIWYAVTFFRKYKNGTEWKDTSNFNRDDLLAVAHVAQKAYDWIWEQSAKEPRAQEVEE